MIVEMILFFEAVNGPYLLMLMPLPHLSLNIYGTTEREKEKSLCLVMPCSLAVVLRVVKRIMITKNTIF